MKHLAVQGFAAGVCALLALAGVASAATEDALDAALRAEFALQSGDNAQAARTYLDAALATDDAALAQRAADIALLAHEDAIAARALVRLRQLDPSSQALAIDEALLALRRADRVAARHGLLAMLQGSADGWKRALRVLALAPDSATSAQVAGDLLDAGHWPDDRDAWLAYGELAQRLGDASLRRRVVAEVLRRFPTEPHAWLLEAARLREQGDPAGARGAIQRALVEGHGAAAVRTDAAAELAALGDLRGASATIGEGPQDDTSSIARAASLARADDRAGLAALYAEVGGARGGATTKAPDPERGLLLGHLAEYLKHDDDALAWYRGIATGAPHDHARVRIAVVLEARGDLAGALATLRAVQHDDNADEEAQRDSYEMEAELLAKHGRKSDALATLDRGLAFYDVDTVLLYSRALLLEGMDRVSESEVDLRSIVAADPDNAEALNALGYTLADRTDRYAEAQALIEKALRLQPDSPAFLDSLGWVQHRLGRDAEALRNLRRAYALQKDAEIAAHLGEVLWLHGDHDGARAVWKEGMALDKDNRALNRTVQTFHP